MFEKFKEDYEKIKGEPFWIIRQNPIYETVREHGGYDHLGCLPDKVYDVLKGYKYKVEKKIVNPYTMHLLVAGEYWLDEETANWIASSRNLKENLKNGKINKRKRPMGM